VQVRAGRVLLRAADEVDAGRGIVAELHQHERALAEPQRRRVARQRLVVRGTRARPVARRRERDREAPVILGRVARVRGMAQVLDRLRALARVDARDAAVGAPRRDRRRGDAVAPADLERAVEVRDRPSPAAATSPRRGRARHRRRRRRRRARSRA
jgi:hypothetical protein